MATRKAQKLSARWSPLTGLRRPTLVGFAFRRAFHFASQRKSEGCPAALRRRPDGPVAVSLRIRLNGRTSFRWATRMRKKPKQKHSNSTASTYTFHGFTLT